jgi:hypothetical protein
VTVVERLQVDRPGDVRDGAGPLVAGGEVVADHGAAAGDDQGVGDGGVARVVVVMMIVTVVAAAGGNEEERSMNRTHDVTPVSGTDPDTRWGVKVVTNGDDRPS